MPLESCQKVAFKYICEKCDYFTNKKSSYDKHLLTSKHQQLTKVNTFSENIAEQTKDFVCTCCKKQFKSRVGLWKHNKICKANNDNEKNQQIDLLVKEIKELKENKNNELIEYLLKENKEIKELILEIVKKDTYSNCNNTTNTNSNNKAFNLQIYLNETCKNAMNLSEFIDSIHPQLSDLITVGELGYVEGISKIIIDKLNKLDFTERPVNCTDKKRDTIYIKDDNIWEKDEGNNKLNKAIKKVAVKNTMVFPQFKQKYPDYCNSDSKYSDQYSNIVIQSLDDSRENNEKVIKNISKVTTIKEK